MPSLDVACEDRRYAHRDREEDEWTGGERDSTVIDSGVTVLGAAAKGAFAVGI